MSKETLVSICSMTYLFSRRCSGSCMIHVPSKINIRTVPAWESESDPGACFLSLSFMSVSRLILLLL